jgi:tellurite resistance protein TehA-like permease
VGLRLFWLALAASLLIRYLRAGGVPFHLGWWAFTFPRAYTVATITLARAWQSTVLEDLGRLLFLVLVAFWWS